MLCLHLPKKITHCFVLLHHLLVMTMALLGAASLDSIAHHHVHSHLLFLADGEFEDLGVGVEKVQVPLVFSSAPVVALLAPAPTTPNI